MCIRFSAGKSVRLIFISYFLNTCQYWKKDIAKNMGIDWEKAKKLLFFYRKCLINIIFFLKNQSLVYLIFIKRRIPSSFETETDKSTFLVAASPRRGDIGSSKCGKCWLLIPAEGLCTLVNTFTHSQQYFRNRLDKHNLNSVFLFSNDPSCKDGNARYETASLKILSD